MTPVYTLKIVTPLRLKAMRKRTVDLEEGGFVQTSASRSIPHFLVAGECTGHVLRGFAGGVCFLGFFLFGFFQKKHLFLFDPLFLNIFNRVTRF